ncbi:Small RNA degrading nuclease [Wickerhamomyces ciferrii]|uniref:Small RNA degrading nuclease n=1 Tax=Wickerhamomyces ciferrii (strain ATCC 14091 / BCRC 22168 / CBS 111 / JCM 3599 / NBRC 0793 / NRRL Y-1031 F-60-10) TaxID=1206466 RepID=K0KSG0_WICCF|nr:Small RNA degrading nuclease [Wickerhamomyces ciferrii]CCH44972.1 Small RNA degrading nuclease [Wickerhamomyces ciferrii]
MVSPGRRLRQLLLTFDDMMNNGQYPIHANVPGNEYGQESVGTFIVSRYYNDRPTYYALDCEMVLMQNNTRQVGRVSLVDRDGDVVIDEYVRPRGPIKSLLTQYSGITRADMQNARYTLGQIQARLLDIVGEDDILIGHAIHNDLKVLRWKHPLIVDTADVFWGDGINNQPPSLKKLAAMYFDINIQNGPHDSVEDARVALDLVKMEMFN